MAVLFLLLGAERRRPSDGDGRDAARPVAELVVRGRHGRRRRRGPRRADVARRRRAIVVEVGRGPRAVRPGRTVLDAGGCLVGPGPGRPAHPPAPAGREEAETVETGARAAALGGYTAVVAMPNTEPAIDNAGDRPRGARAGTAAAGRGGVAGAITVGRAGRAAGPDGRAGRARGAAVHRRRGRGPRRRAHAPGPRLRPGPRGHPGPALRGRARWPPAGPCTRGRGRAGSGCPGIPAAAEEAMVARDLALVRLTGAPMHFLHLSTAGLGRAGPAGQGRGAAGHRRGRPAPLRPHRRRGGRLRPGLQGQPAAAHAPPDVAAVRRGWPTARSTPSPPTTPRTPPRPRTCPSTEAPPGMLGLETALALASPSWLGSERGAGPLRPGRVLRPAELAAGGHRRADGERPAAGGTAPTAARSRRAPPPTCACSTPRRGGRSRPSGWPAAAATPPTPGASWWPGPPHGPAGRAGGGRRRGPAVSADARTTAPAPALLVLADGEVFEGEAAGADRGRCRHRRARSSTPPSAATKRWSPTPPTPARSSPSPTRTSATTAPTPPTTRPAGPSAAGWWCAT